MDYMANADIIIYTDNMTQIDAAPLSLQKSWNIRGVSWSKIANSGASDGVLLKAIERINDTDYYLKLSNYDSYRGFFGHESVNELIACRLGKLLGFGVPDGFLKKALVKVEGVEYETYVFAVESYKSTNSRISFEEYYKSNRLTAKESPLDFCKRNGWAADIYMMFVFDYLIINRDRHGANLEVLKNSKKKLSPLFDNGLSFLCTNTDTSGVSDFDALLDRPVNNFIGERSLELNLSYIDLGLAFNELTGIHKPFLFSGLDGILNQVYYDKIWEILTLRWEHVKGFRVA